MKIIRLEAQNVKRLRAVAIEPKGHVVRVVGRNGQGKSSLLDAIVMAIAGMRGADAKPVRIGEDEAIVTLDLGDLRIKRVIHADGGSRLEVTNVEGAKYGSPQAMLDKLLGPLNFDPLAFSRMKPEQKASALKRVVALDVDLDELDAQRQWAYGERTRTNRDLAAARAQLAGTKGQVDGDVPTDVIDSANLLAQMEEASDTNTSIGRQQNARQRMQHDIDDLREQARARRERADMLLAEAETNEKQADVLAVELSNAPTLPEPVDVSALRREIEAVEEANSRIRAMQNVRRMAEAQEREVTKLAAYSDCMTTEIEKIDRTKADAMARVTMPVEGLAFTSTGLTYHGIPVEQCSTAEQIRVATGVAMASTSELRVLRIAEGSLLDEDALAVIATMAEEKNWQVFLECVGNRDSVGIVIEDGSVAAINEAPIAVRTEAPALALAE